METTSQADSALEMLWRRRISQLGTRSLFTSTWRDLKQALLLREDGESETVARWADETEADLIARYERLEESGCLEQMHRQDPEVRVAATFIKEGIENWLDAVAVLLDGGPPEQILERARAGQRLLVGVQLLDQERAHRVSRLLSRFT